MFFPIEQLAKEFLIVGEDKNVSFPLVYEQRDIMACINNYTYGSIFPPKIMRVHP